MSAKRFNQPLYAFVGVIGAVGIGIGANKLIDYEIKIAAQQDRATAVQKANEDLRTLTVAQQIDFVDAGKATLTCQDFRTGDQKIVILPLPNDENDGPKRWDIMRRLNDGALKIGICTVSLK